MAMPPSSSGILEWITANTRPKASSTAELRYDRMASQSARRLPEVYVPLSHRTRGHWVHRGCIWDFILSMHNAAKVLDIGPGDGWPSLLMAPHTAEILGIDESARRVEACRDNAGRLHLRNIGFEQMSACRIDLPGSTFDGVVAASSIEQTRNPRAAFREIHRVLKPGGWFRMSYEVWDSVAEPVREVVQVRDNSNNGTFEIEYVISWTEAREERGYVLEVVPQSEQAKQRLLQAAGRCATDPYPQRDPRFGRSLARAVLSLNRADVRAARYFRLRHFRAPHLLRMLESVGFTEVRLKLSGGALAGRLFDGLEQVGRLDAAAPVMDELCRAAAQLSLDPIVTATEGDVLARKA